MHVDKQLAKWRLILGAETQEKIAHMGGSSFELSADEKIMDEALAAIYDETSRAPSTAKNPKQQGGTGKSAPTLAKWLTDVRKYFPEDVVSVIQSDAIAKKGLKQLLLEPETLKSVKPDVSMVATLMALNRQIPENAKESARALVQSLVDELMKKMEQD